MEIIEEDHQLLDELSKGRCTQGYLVDTTDIPRHKIHQRLKIYEAVGIAKNIHDTTALWELVEDPRENNNDSTS